MKQIAFEIRETNGNVELVIKDESDDPDLVYVVSGSVARHLGDSIFKAGCRVDQV